MPVVKKVEAKEKHIDPMSDEGAWIASKASKSSILAQAEWQGGLYVSLYRDKPGRRPGEAESGGSRQASLRIVVGMAVAGIACIDIE